MHTLKSTYAKKYYLRFAKILTKLRFRKKLVNGVLMSLFYIYKPFYVFQVEYVFP